MDVLTRTQPAAPAAPARRVQAHLAVLQIGLAYLAVRTFWTLSFRSWGALDSAAVEAVAKFGLWVVPCVILLCILGRQTPRASWKELGLGGSPWRGVAFGLAATVPMALAMFVTPIGEADMDVLLDAVIVGPFAEEVLFRGFLCWQLVRRAGWSLGWAIGVSAAIFGLAHAHAIDASLLMALQGPDPRGFHIGLRGDELQVLPAIDPWLRDVGRTAGQLVATVPYALGGAVFAWIAVRWGSLWPAIALHGWLNLWWVLAETGVRVAVEITPMTIAHGLAIALAVGITLARSRARELRT